MPTNSLTSSLHELSISAAADAIRSGWISSTDYATALLKRANDLADLRAFITLDETTILDAAKQADLKQKAGERLGPLHGVPIAIKDSMNTVRSAAVTGCRVARPEKSSISTYFSPLRATCVTTANAPMFMNV